MGLKSLFFNDSITKLFCLRRNEVLSAAAEPFSPTCLLTHPVRHTELCMSYASGITKFLPGEGASSDRSSTFLPPTSVLGNVVQQA